MTDEMKKEFTLKISQANKSRILVLTYELALQYLEDARNAADREEFNRGVQHAKNCIDQLRNVLDYSQEISLYLFRIYNYVYILMDKAIIRHNMAILAEAKALLQKLHDAFDQVASKDKSEPAMKNIETVYSGITYGRNGVRDNVAVTNRGYIV
ncbi:MAG: flagellar protein FliS [Lachnospiraceae bacterium]|nr:flagellar protein FliS [Lachnospiraceae bacterium]